MSVLNSFSVDIKFAWLRRPCTAKLFSKYFPLILTGKLGSNECYFKILIVLNIRYSLGWYPIYTFLFKKKGPLIILPIIKLKIDNTCEYSCWAVPSYLATWRNLKLDTGSKIECNTIKNKKYIFTKDPWSLGGRKFTLLLELIKCVYLGQ